MVMAKYCKGCGEQIHPKRVEILPNTTTCVSCSNTGMKRGVTVLNGDVEKDDTWVDIVFMEPEDYEHYIEQEGKLKRIVASSPKAEVQNFDEESNEPIQPNFEE
jgi:hypothetical protein